MEKNAGQDELRYSQKSDLEGQDIQNTTLTAHKETTVKKKGVIVSSSPFPDPDLLTPHNAKRRVVSDTLLLLSILFMVAWPWAFFGGIRAKGGVVMSPGLAESVLSSPQLTTAIVTLLGTFNRILATFLFGCAIVRYGQELAAREGRPLTVFGVSALLAFRHMSLMWGIGELWALLKRGRRLAVIASLFSCLASFALIPSGTAGLLTPVRFNKVSELIGSELDFTSDHPDCSTWLADIFAFANINMCDWMISPDGHYQYPTCLDPQFNDILAAGQKNMITSIGINVAVPQQPLIDETARFLGPLRGVLPVGPDGFRGFNTLDNWTPSSSSKLDYTYTLVQQGLDSEVHCLYDNDSPIMFAAVEGAGLLLLASSGTCDPNKGLRGVLRGVEDYPTLNTNNTLTFWACARNQSIPAGGSDDATYVLYLRGRVNYSTSVGNMTCTFSRLRSRDYAVTYTRSLGYFTAERVTTLPEPGRKTAESFLELLAMAFGVAVWEAQTLSSNAVAESVFRTGTRFLGLSEEPDPRYLELYEAMIQGIFEHFAMRARLIASLGHPMKTAPRSCVRPVYGKVSYEVFGWYSATGGAQAGLLIPMTLINLGSLALFVAAMVMGRFKYRSDIEPMNARSLLAAKVVGTDTGSDGVGQGRDKTVDWDDRVRF